MVLCPELTKLRVEKMASNTNKPLEVEELEEIISCLKEGSFSIKNGYLYSPRFRKSEMSCQLVEQLYEAIKKHNAWCKEKTSSLKQITILDLCHSKVSNDGLKKLSKLKVKINGDIKSRNSSNVNLLSYYTKESKNNMKRIIEQSEMISKYIGDKFYKKIMKIINAN